MEYKTLTYGLDKGIGTITFQQADRLNPISTTFIRELDAALSLAGSDPELRVLVLTGAGKAFSAGGDLSDLRPGFEGVEGFVRHMELVNRGAVALIEFEKPVIAAVNGTAVGAGMNLALACDLIIASERAKFSQIFGQLGLCPDVAGTYLLPRLVGRAKAKELVFTYRMIEAQEALEMGLVNKVVPHKALLDTAYDYARRIGGGPPLAFRLAKKLMNRSTETDLKTMLDLEQLAQSLCANSLDHKEGVDAFFEKRPPVFRGK